MPVLSRQVVNILETEVSVCLKQQEQVSSFLGTHFDKEASRFYNKRQRLQKEKGRQLVPWKYLCLLYA